MEAVLKTARDALGTFVVREPLLIRTLVMSALAAGVAFNPVQQQAVAGLVDAVLVALAAGVFVDLRGAVTPVADPKGEAGKALAPVDLPAGPSGAF